MTISNSITNSPVQQLMKQNNIKATSVEPKTEKFVYTVTPRTKTNHIISAAVALAGGILGLKQPLLVKNSKIINAAAGALSGYAIGGFVGKLVDKYIFKVKSEQIITEEPVMGRTAPKLGAKLDINGSQVKY